MKRARPLLVAGLVFLASVPPADAGDRLVWSTMLATTGTLDLRAGAAAEARGALEVGPVFSRVGHDGRVPLKLLAGAAVVASAQALKRKGHRAWAWALVSVVAVGWAAAALHNHRLHR